MCAGCICAPYRRLRRDPTKVGLPAYWTAVVGMHSKSEGSNLYARTPRHATRQGSCQTKDTRAGPIRSYRIAKDEASVIWLGES